MWDFGFPGPSLTTETDTRSMRAHCCARCFVWPSAMTHTFGCVPCQCDIHLILLILLCMSYHGLKRQNYVKCEEPFVHRQILVSDGNVQQSESFVFEDVCGPSPAQAEDREVTPAPAVKALIGCRLWKSLPAFTWQR